MALTRPNTMRLLPGSCRLPPRKQRGWPAAMENLSHQYQNVLHTKDHPFR